MLRYNIKKLLAEKEYAENRKISMNEVSNDTGISKATLYRMANPSGDFSTKTRYLEMLCDYFQCTPNDLIEFIRDTPIYKKNNKNQDTEQ